MFLSDLFQLVSDADGQLVVQALTGAIPARGIMVGKSLHKEGKFDLDVSIQRSHRHGLQEN